MSSSDAGEDFVPGRKLLVHVAENGHSFEFDCDESTPVEMVQRIIERLCGLHPNDQFLLCLDRKLEPQRLLSFYKLPQDDREVFLYNRPRLHPDAPPPPPEAIDVPETPDPSPPSAARDPHPLDDAPDPALKALPSYERQFRFHFHRGQAVFKRTQTKLDACQRLVGEQWVQERALKTARGSMDQGYRVVHQSFSDFVKLYSQQQRYHSDLLSNFRRDIDRLRSCRLHPALQTENRKCLLDFLKDDLRKLTENCPHSHRQFEVKVLQFKSAFGELKRWVDDLGLGMVSDTLKDFEVKIKDHQKYLTEQKSIMQSLSKDVNTVKKLVDDCLSCQTSVSLRPHDAVSALGPMYDVHEKNHLPRMQLCDNAVTKLLGICMVKKNEMNLFVHSFMQKVVHVQSLIRDIRLQFPAFMEAMDHQDDIFEDLKLVRGVAPAYRACLAEVIRRKSSMKLYMGKAGEYAEKLARERELEINRRNEFLRAQSCYVPRDILASLGLFDSPKQCDVNIVPFDTNLLEIDLVDLDRYAPDYSVGALSRNNSVSKGSLSTHGSGSNLTELEGNSMSANEKFDSGAISEVCESVHVAGTGKLEVENAQLRADLASAIAQICSISQVGNDLLDDSKLNSSLKDALLLKDEYSKHLQSMLKMKEAQCSSYEKRIQELEQRLSDHYLQGQRLSVSKDASDSTNSVPKVDDCKSDICGDCDIRMPYTTEISTEPMEEASCTSASLDPKIEQFAEQLGKPREGVDENMIDFPGALNVQVLDSAKNPMDASMAEHPCEDHQSGDKNSGDQSAEGYALSLIKNSVAEGTEEPLGAFPCGSAVGSGSISEPRDLLVSELQNALAEKSSHCDEIESQLKAAIDEVSSLQQELEISRKLLDESQMNCAHLENCLHEAREEAHTKSCTAARRASEYNTLRTSAVKMRSLFERLRSCVTAAGGVADFVDSLRSLAVSLSSAAKEDEDDGTMEFRECIRVLSDKVSILSRRRTEVLDRCSRLDATNGHLVKELEEKKELVQSLYTKLQLEKQVSKEKISYSRLEVHELAVFVLNTAGHYVAINRNHLNYFLSAESVALFAEHLPTRPTYIIGQIVHIEHRIVKPLASIRTEHVEEMDLLTSDTSSGCLVPQQVSASNPYNLPIGCEYFVVTVAMLPDTIHSPPS
uniref:Autophagy-related protein 11 n=1 Tax=Anthurium amnicola TaxID=1678845 RepID=A0A1D1Z8U2_9ARAE